MNAKKIDVLAVMDSARRTISAQSKLSDDVMAHLAEDVKQARDAVAELMESSKDAGWLLAHLGKMTSLPEVTAAIERDLPPLLSAISRLDHAAQTKCNCPGEGKSNPASHAPNCPFRATQPAQASNNEREKGEAGLPDWETIAGVAVETCDDYKRIVDDKIANHDLLVSNLKSALGPNYDEEAGIVCSVAFLAAKVATQPAQASEKDNG